MFHLLLAVIYLSFISLGLPDSLLGAAWPSMYGEFGVPVSYASAVFMIISAGTIVSSLQSDRLTRRLGTGKVTALSVAMTAAALFGFSFSRSFWTLCLWAVPYGLGAGSVDASLNNYVAVHYTSRHMSWLHCMWGIGASVGPYILTYAMTSGQGWNMGYRYIGFLQTALTAILLVSLPLWKNGKRKELSGEDEKDTDGVPKEESRERGALEQTAGLWGSSYLSLHCGVPAEEAARFTSWLFLGVTAGRFLSGFLTLALNDTRMVRLGQGIAALGIAVLLAAGTGAAAPFGLALIGLGCAPIYPCLLHSTPERFGEENSQAVFGVQMASAYVGSCLMPPLFGLIAEHVAIGLFPVYMLLVLALMTAMHERTVRAAAGNRRRRL